MKTFLFFLTLIICSFSPCSGQVSVSQALDSFPILKNAKSIPIMVLGTFHFNHSENASDVKGEDNFDIYSTKRQQELLALLEKLRKFKPTKIAVEMMEYRQPRMDSLFNAYRADRWKLGQNEYYQVGFRLAKDLGLSGVYCVDTRPEQVEVDTTVADWESYAQQRGELARWESYNEPNRLSNTYIDGLLPRMSISDYLIFMNHTVVKRRYKQFFLTGLVDVGSGDTYVGADLTGYWYRRNTRIFTNIKRLATSDDDRILVIYGNSHAWILEELFNASPEFSIVKVDTVIK